MGEGVGIGLLLSSPLIFVVLMRRCAHGVCGVLALPQVRGRDRGCERRHHRGHEQLVAHPHAQAAEEQGHPHCRLLARQSGLAQPSPAHASAQVCYPDDAMPVSEWFMQRSRELTENKMEARWHLKN